MLGFGLRLSSCHSWNLPHESKAAAEALEQAATTSWKTAAEAICWQHLPNLALHLCALDKMACAVGSVMKDASIFSVNICYFKEGCHTHTCKLWPSLIKKAQLCTILYYFGKGYSGRPNVRFFMETACAPIEGLPERESHKSASLKLLPRQKLHHAILLCKNTEKHQGLKVSPSRSAAASPQNSTQCEKGV